MSGETRTSAGRGVGRSRWAAIGAAVAVTLGAGGLIHESFAAGEQSGYVAMTPCRLLDTRSASVVGDRDQPIGAEETFTARVIGTHGNCTIPTGAVGVQMNVVAVNGTAASYLTVFPGGEPLPLSSNLNWVAGAPPVPNSVTATLSPDGTISFYNNTGTVDIAADITGYYLSGGGAAGMQGPAGVQGPRGEPGPQGPAGTAGIVAINVVTEGGQMPVGSSAGVARATCPSGTVLTGGGASPQHIGLTIYASFPEGNSWRVTYTRTTTTSPANFAAHAICATLG